MFAHRITEQPHKLPLNAALLGYLLLAPAAKKSDRKDTDGSASADKAADAEKKSDEEQNIGEVLLKDLIRAYRSWLDARMWRNVRLSVSRLAQTCMIHR